MRLLERKIQAMKKGVNMWKYYLHYQDEKILIEAPDFNGIRKRVLEEIQIHKWDPDLYWVEHISGPIKHVSPSISRITENI